MRRGYVPETMHGSPDYQDLYERLSNAITSWRQDDMGDVGSGCPFDAIVVLAARIRKFEIALKQIAQMEVGVGQPVECCEHPACEVCEEMKEWATNALKKDKV